MRSRLAELRAREALEIAGLDARQPLERASSVTNEVWLGDGVVLRVGTARRRLLREAALADRLPPAVGYPPILFADNVGPADVLIHRRLDAVPIAHVWPDLSPRDRARAVSQWASRVRALHQTDTSGLSDIDSPQSVTADPDTTIAQVTALLERLESSGVDASTATAARRLATTLAPAIRGPVPLVLVHGDLTFENALWDGNRVVALLDLEFAARRPIDVDLDTVLRMVAYPRLHVGPAFADRTDTASYASVPTHFRNEYNAPFRVAGLRDRLRFYALGFTARELAQSGAGHGRPPKGHPLDRLRRLVNGESHLDALSL